MKNITTTATSLLFICLTFCQVAFAQTNACPTGTFSVTESPDKTAISILFDQFIVEAGGNTGREIDYKYCHMSIPLNLPEGYGIGVYQVDYRGFAALDKRQAADLYVDYALGKRSPRFHKRLRKGHVGDFTFTQKIGARQMKFAGCGSSAVLNFTAGLRVISKNPDAQAVMALDSIDAASRGGLVYRMKLQPCK